VLPLNGGQPVTAVQSLADCPDWSRDSKLLFYISYAPVDEKATLGEMNDTTKRPFLATLNYLAVADSEGNILSKFGTSKKLVDVFAADTSQVRCLPDGSIVFHARFRTYPSIRTSESHACLFRLSPDLKSVEPIAGSADLPGDAMEHFEPNQDGTKIAVPGSHGEIAVLDLPSGKVTTLEKVSKESLKFTPKWRTPDELCYPSRNFAVSSNGHNVDIVLQSMSQPDHRIILSKDWPASSVKFLKDPKDSEQDGNKPQRKKKGGDKKPVSKCPRRKR
jgi:hypothetical protein